MKFKVLTPIVLLYSSLELRTTIKRILTQKFCPTLVKKECVEGRKGQNLRFQHAVDIFDVVTLMKSPYSIIILMKRNYAMF